MRAWFVCVRACVCVLCVRVCVLCVCVCVCIHVHVINAVCVGVLRGCVCVRQCVIVTLVLVFPSCACVCVCVCGVRRICVDVCVLCRRCVYLVVWCVLSASFRVGMLMPPRLYNKLCCLTRHASVSHARHARCRHVHTSNWFSGVTVSGHISTSRTSDDDDDDDDDDDSAARSDAARHSLSSRLHRTASA
jgi:hypothetical protein